MFVFEVKSLKVTTSQEAAVGVDRNIEEATTEVEADHMTSVVITLHAIP